MGVGNTGLAVNSKNKLNASTVIPAVGENQIEQSSIIEKRDKREEIKQKPRKRVFDLVLASMDRGHSHRS